MTNCGGRKVSHRRIRATTSPGNRKAPRGGPDGSDPRTPPEEVVLVAYSMPAGIAFGSTKQKLKAFSTPTREFRAHAASSIVNSYIWLHDGIWVFLPNVGSIARQQGGTHRRSMRHIQISASAKSPTCLYRINSLSFLPHVIGSLPCQYGCMLI